MNTKRNVVVFILVIAVMALLPGSSTVMASGGRNPIVVPPNAHPHGKTYPAWAGMWLQYFYTAPASENPFAGTMGNHCASKVVRHVALIITNPTVPEPYSCSVPAGAMVFTPLGGIFCDTLSDPFPRNKKELRACATGFRLTDLHASLDGVALEDLDDYFFISPVVAFTLSEANGLGYPAGSSGKAMMWGPFIMITRLRIGEHTIHAHASYPDLSLTQDFTIKLTVKP